MKTKISILVIILLSVIFFSSCGIMAGTKASPEMMTFEKIIDIPGKEKNELYINANSWFVENFNSAESVIEFQDKESGKIMGKYVYTYNEGMYYHTVRQVISIDLKDEKVRITIKEPYFKTTGDVMNGTYTSNVSYKPLVYQKGLERAHQEWNELAESLVSSLKSSSDW